MRPPSAVTPDPRPEPGVPWGRDLYTFVTSAAGHVMRALQRPRKNRPSKRQVNHRRFLHNMIQRKFADIEASNYRLASALYVTQREKPAPSPPPCSPPRGRDLGEAPSGAAVLPKEMETRAEGDEGGAVPVENESEVVAGTRTSSPDFSPLSLSSCDFGEAADAQWTDLMDLFGDELNLDSICAYDEVEEEEEGEDARGGVITHQAVDDGSCHHGDQGQIEDFGDLSLIRRPPDSICCAYSSSDLWAPGLEEGPCLPPQPPPPPSDLDFLPFEGVARSFPAPANDPGERPVQTPPHGDDWLFTDILRDRRALQS